MTTVDLVAWGECLDPGSLDDLRDRVCLGASARPDAEHATLYAAALLDDGRVRIDVVTAWAGPECLTAMLDEVPVMVAKVVPVRSGFDWFHAPQEELVREFADLVSAGRIAHSGEALLDWQVGDATGQYDDAVCAAAGAVHLALTIHDERSE